MKVILLEDVKSLGKKGEIVEVSNGYAANFILPKKLGVEATSKNLNDLKLQNANKDKVAKELLEAAEELKTEIAEMQVIVNMKAGEGGKTFGAISSKEIAKAAMEQFNLDIDKKKIQVKEPIRTIGTHEVTIKIHPKVVAKLKVKVQEA